MTGFGVGVELAIPASNNIISGNEITGSYYWGIFIGGHYWPSQTDLICTDNSIVGNNIGSRGPGGIGIDWGAHDNSVTGNNIATCFNGINLQQSCHDNSIVGNNLTANSRAVSMEATDNNNIFYHNSFVGNIEQIDTEGSMNGWDNGYPSGGNYWSDYTGAWM